MGINLDELRDSGECGRKKCPRRSDATFLQRYPAAVSDANHCKLRENSRAMLWLPHFSRPLRESIT